MITKNQYDTYKPQVEAYEAEQARIAKYKGKSVCPFCSGSKTVPFVRSGKSQECKTCDKNGMVTNRYLASIDLEECIKQRQVR